MTTSAEDEFTQLVDADFPRVDLVGKGANGVPRWLIAKQDASAGLLDPGYVRDLIAKSEPDKPGSRERVTMPNGITVSGSAADIAAFIHNAGKRHADDRTPAAGDTTRTPADYNTVVKAKYSAEDRKKMASSGAAMDDGSYPIKDEADLKNAIHAVGRGGSSHNAIRKHIISRARSLGKSSMIPDNWGSDGSLKETVSKDGLAGTIDELTPDPDDGVDGLDPTVPLAAPGDLDDLPGDPADPGSPAWEAIDAATAQKWLSIAARLKNALSLLSDREMLEAATVDPDDAESAMDLQDAMSAADYVISQLAVFAAGEQAEADLAAEAMEQVGKAMNRFDPAPLDVIEGLAAVRKAGRVLSAANEAKIRQAAQSLSEVLASLPQAPDSGQLVAKEEGAAVEGTQTAASTETVAKETATPEAQAADTGPVNAGGTTGLGQPRDTGPDGALPADGPQASRPGDAAGRQVIKASLPVAVYDQYQQLAGIVDPDAITDRITKADGDGGTKMQAVFDQNGCLIGVCDPADITPVAGAGSNDDGEDSMPGSGGGGDDLEPQPSADAGTPAGDAHGDDGNDVAKAAEDAITVTQDVLKSTVEQATRSALETQGAAHQEVVAKMAADMAGQAEEITALKARLAMVEEQPAMPKVVTNGAVPPAHMMRGQDQGTPPVDVAKAAERRKQLYQAPDAREQNRIAEEMKADAIGALAAIHRR